MASIAASVTGSTFNATTHAFDLPEVGFGQRLLVFLAIDDVDAGIAALTITDSGWTVLVNNVPWGAFGGIVRGKMFIASKISDGTETTINLTSNQAEDVAYIGTTIADFDAATAVAVSADPPIFSFAQAPALNPTNWDVEDTLWIAFVAADPGYAFATGAPANYTDFTVSSSPGGNDSISIAIASRVNTTASEDPGDFTFTGSPSLGGYTLAIRPGIDGPAPLIFSLRESGTSNIGGVESDNEVTVDLFDGVTNSQRTNGLVDYRLIYLHNEEADKSADAKAYIGVQLDSGRQYAVGSATEAIDATVGAIVSDTTAPAGVTFSTGTTAGTGVTLGNLGPGQSKGVWIRRTITAGTAADTTNPGRISFELAP